MSFTASQKCAIENEGNTLVMAGAGAGKTRTLVERCVNQIRKRGDGAALKRMLVVTFTEAAAAEARERIRQELEKWLTLEPNNAQCEQELATLDSANIKTIHGFCFSLIREYFFLLELDPAVSVLDQHQTSILASDVLDDLLRKHFTGADAESKRLREIAWERFRGWSTPLRDAVLELHQFTQTRPQPKAWYEKQISLFESNQCNEWHAWREEFIQKWATESAAYFRRLGHPNLDYCAGILERLNEENRAESFAELRERRAGTFWNRQKKLYTSRVDPIFDQAAFLEALEREPGKADPMEQDWRNCREFGLALLKLAQEFGGAFAAAKKAAGGVDFHDLEQLTLQLLTQNQNEPSELALELRERFDQIFVDEYQDINQAQDLIIRSLSKSSARGNTFVVGDVKQSIYSFRQAEPGIFQSYTNSNEWKSISLQENFRSSQSILTFVNRFFGWLMQGRASGITYDDRARLLFGNEIGRRDLKSRPGQIEVELHLINTSKEERESGGDDDQEAELSGTEQEARIVAARLMELRTSGTEIFCQKEKRRRPIEWSDMVVLLRALSSKAEVYSKAFNEANIPLHIKRSSFFETREALDLCSLLQILDNPLQDIPLLAVLRSPMVGLSANELGWIRASSAEKPFWRALNCFHRKKTNADGWKKVDAFLTKYHKWRDSKSVSSLGQRLEVILADTQYLEWVAIQPRGKERSGNVQHLLRIARNFDQNRSESLYLFLRHIDLLQEVSGDIEPPPSATGDCVRLMTIHQSKGLEFPVVAVPDLGKPINFSDSRKSILLDDQYGLCLKGLTNLRTYPTLPHWVAAQAKRAKAMAEEMRVLYVALTRAENRLLLFGGTTQNRLAKWEQLGVEKPFAQELLQTSSMLDWVGSFLAYQSPSTLEALKNESRENQETRIVAEGLLGVKIHQEFEAQRPPEPPKMHAYDPELITKLRSDLPFNYQHWPATREAAKTTVTALRRKSENDDQESRIFIKPVKADGRERGTAYHRLFQEIDLAGDLTVDGIRKQAQQVLQKGRISEQELKQIDFEEFSRFWNSTIGVQIIQNKAVVYREVPFTAALDAGALANLDMTDSLSIPEHEFVVMQGMADLIVLLPKEIWLIDFKTDQIRNGDLSGLCMKYQPQLNLYAHALHAIYRKPVTRKILYFVSNGETMEWK